MTTFIPANSWPKTEVSSHYQVFAVRVRELVHPEAQDIYRVHALSTTDKLQELARCAAEVLEGQYPRKALDPIVDEVHEAVTTDPVAKRMLQERGVNAESISIAGDKSTEELLSLSRLWLGLISEGYRRGAQKMILESLTKTKERKLLQCLAKIYVATLVSNGFHRRHILDSVDRVFFTNKIGKCVPSLAKKFFDLFPEKKKKFSVLILGDDASIKRASESFNFKFIASDAEVKSVAGFTTTNEIDWAGGERALFWDEATGHDPYNAAQNIELFFALPSFFNVVYPSTEGIKIGKRCLLRDKKSGVVSEVFPDELLAPVHSYTSQIIYSAPMVAKFAQYHIAQVKRDGASYEEIHNSLTAAASALETRHPQAQLVSMWSAFEALLPQPFRDEKSARISHFSRLIMPAVVRKYIKGKYRIFLDDVVRHVDADLTKILGEELKPYDRPRAFFEALRDNGKKCDRLFEEVAASPLAISRINQLFELARSPNAILDKVHSHERRVEWQIHRIYRERNAIVHAGSSSDAIPVLVENAFLYYRLVMRGVQFASEEFGVHHPHGALQLLGGQYSSYKTHLQKLSQNSDKDERRRLATDLVFGNS